MEPVTTQSPVTASRPRVIGMLIVAALLAWGLVASLFAVDVTEYCLVTRFGAVVQVVREPGLQIKAPFDSVVRL
ncbi:MAG: hypothetical protein ABI619_07455, partial [Betaproteobacteria bacterium]